MKIIEWETEKVRKIPKKNEMRFRSRKIMN